MKQKRFTLWEAVLLVAVIVLVGGMLLPVLSKKRENTGHRSCGGNLKQMGLALLGYSGDYDGFFPDTPIGNNLEALDENHTNDLPNSKVYNCPSKAYDGPSSERKPTYLASKSDYWYVGSGLRDDNTDSTTIRLVFDQSGNHPKNEWMNVLFADGHVDGAKPDGKRGWNDNDPKFIFTHPQGRPIPETEPKGKY